MSSSNAPELTAQPSTPPEARKRTNTAELQPNKKPRMDTPASHIQRRADDRDDLREGVTKARKQAINIHQIRRAAGVLVCFVVLFPSSASSDLSLVRLR